MAVRYSHNLATAPITDLFSFIESAFPDTLVARRPMPDGLEGALIRAGKDWLIVVNTADRYLARQRFTAAHELGHRLFDADRTAPHLEQNLFRGGPVETRANAFAVNLLLPVEVLLDRRRAGTLNPVSDEDVVALAVEYGISLSSLSFHLKNNNLISERRRLEIGELSPLTLAARLGYGARVQAEREARGITHWPSRYVRLAASAFQRRQITKPELERLLADDPVITPLLEDME